MRTPAQVLGGGSIIAVWSRLPGSVKAALFFGLGLVAAAETTSIVNDARWSASVSAGKGAQGDAQLVDPSQVERDQKAGAPVTTAAVTATGAARKAEAEGGLTRAQLGAKNAPTRQTHDAFLTGRPVANIDVLETETAMEKAAVAREKEAEARIKNADADSRTQSIEEIEAKRRAGKKLTYTESLALEQYRKVTLENRKIALESSKIAEDARAAAAQANMQTYISGELPKIMRGSTGGHTSDPTANMLLDIMRQ